MKWFGLWAAACAALLSGIVAAPVLAEPLPVKTFLSEPVLKSVVLSPNGGFLAFIITRDHRTAAVVRDLSTQKLAVALSLPADEGEIRSLSWKGDDRLVVTATAYISKVVLSDGRKVNVIDPRLLVVDRDGQHQRILQLAAGRAQGMALLDILPDDPSHVLVQGRYGANSNLGVFRTDINSGESTAVEDGDNHTTGWRANAKGELILRYEQRGRVNIIQGRTPANGGWVEIARITPTDVQQLRAFEVLGISEDPTKVYVATNPVSPADGDTRNVHLFDLTTHTLGPPLVPAPKYDVEGIVQARRTGRLLGVCYYADVWTCDLADADKSRDLAAARNFFDGARNIVLTSQSDDGQKWVLHVIGPDEPSSYYLFDRAKKHIDIIGAVFPDLRADQLGEQNPYSYKARDGATIPAYLTRPPDAAKGRLPLIVMPHGGPEARDHLGYDMLSQYLATRGYLVLQPNFRGSAGYGVAFRDAGRKQWGLRSQDDITDGVNALVAAGEADPKRVCIAGASYGGYAALIGGARGAGLYKCVISIAGVSDLPAMMKMEKELAERDKDDTIYNYWRDVMGDPVTDHDKLVAASGVSYAANYPLPVLLIHGAADRTVPISQSDEMNAALTAAHRDVTYITLKGGHGGWGDEDWTRIYQSMDAFLAKHIPPGAAAP